MPIDNWLSALRQHGHATVDGDLEALASLPHHFLTQQCVCAQVKSLSGHLAALKTTVRREVIAYSLYVRQMDVILESGARSFCAGHCPNPPVGCCNRDHFVILNMTDLMSSRNSPKALHMAHVIGLMQRLESAHNLGRGRRIRPGGCACLAEDGCTLRLFKSPRCAHYLCENLEQGLLETHGQGAAPFLAAMKYTSNSTISSLRDFTNPDAITEGAALFPRAEEQ